MSVRLSWKGDELLKRISGAEVPAIAQTVEETAAAARTDHGWSSHSGAAAASIQASPARRAGSRVVGAIEFAMRPVWFLERGWIHHATGDLTIERAANQHFRDLLNRIRDAAKR